MLRYILFILILIILSVSSSFIFAYDSGLDTVTYPSSSSVDEHLGLGTNYMKQGKDLEAEKEFKQATQENARYYLGYYALGTLYLKQKRWEDSISVFNEGISYVGFNKRLYLHLAIAYMRKGDLDNAEKTIRVIMDKNADDANTRRIFWQIKDLKSGKKEAGSIFLYTALFFLILAISFILKAVKK